jgi:hypothetical protein
MHKNVALNKNKENRAPCKGQGIKNVVSMLKIIASNSKTTIH